MNYLSSLLPYTVKPKLKQLRNSIRSVLYAGTGKSCPICQKSARKFCEYGGASRNGAQCPHCGSLERHRLLWLFLKRKTDLFDGKPKKMLHVAPELCFEPKFKALLGDRYLSADLFNPSAMVKMDITNIEYPDASFDVIYCSHVLEHVDNDRKAMKEFLRTLKPTGWAILLVPITAEMTYEDATIRDPEGRLKAFGQRDHVRKYGPDYADRLREVGFQVHKFDAKEFVSGDEITQMGLSEQGTIYFCKK